MEDILSINQRPKVDEVDGILFCLLNMLYYNNEKQTVEQEQISIALGKDFVISFQEDANRDVFDLLRHKLKSAKQQDPPVPAPITSATPCSILSLTIISW